MKLTENMQTLLTEANASILSAGSVLQNMLESGEFDEDALDSAEWDIVQAVKRIALAQNLRYAAKTGPDQERQ
jgi:hypothetical protein